MSFSVLAGNTMLLIDEKRATFEDLHREPGKAELIGGRIERFTSTGKLPGRVAKLILLFMSEFVETFGRGETFGDNVAYAIPELPSGRESFSPDASYFDGPEQDDEMEFIQGPPTFAVEVRSNDGYGNTAAMTMAKKRTDYFAAGTKVCGMWILRLNVFTHIRRLRRQLRERFRWAR